MAAVAVDRFPHRLARFQCTVITVLYEMKTDAADILNYRNVVCPFV